MLDEVQRREEPGASMDEFDCPQLIVDAGFQENDAFATDADCEPVYLSNDSKFVPMHVLLIGECQLLKRLKDPSHVGKNFQRFFENFVSTLPGRSIPLLQPEACLFPSIFSNNLRMVLFPVLYLFFFTMTKTLTRNFNLTVFASTCV